MFPAMLAALAELDPAKWLFYDDQIKGRLSEAAQKRWETFLMSTAGRRYRTRVYNEIDATAEARGRVEGRVEGRAEGVARATLALLEKRGLTVPAKIHDRILACTDTEQADLWFDRAFTAMTAEDVVRVD
ncbi:hypothetical protein [Pseudofrankia asymbiotica]|uniref:DUF4351 domain-containing protein n=1 Tax=Pseudofrankia asymbiotica TaxID=1834516 RepID=A0A1V2ID45_9ACTN|nr:hypothetical protein [Pseudofrankia asymbiotica]ONH31037.1 hypothetical protein BL253_10855 [Pseudofrankia asymbiotica]